MYWNFCTFGGASAEESCAREDHRDAPHCWFEGRRRPAAGRKSGESESGERGAGPWEGWPAGAPVLFTWERETRLTPPPSPFASTTRNILSSVLPSRHSSPLFPDLCPMFLVDPFSSPLLALFLVLHYLYFVLPPSSSSSTHHLHYKY